MGLFQSEFATFEKTLLALLPMLVMAVKQTITIRDSITAYSTAVGPFSSARKWRALFSVGCGYPTSLAGFGGVILRCLAEEISL